jgi:hypothetical protein
LVVLHWVELLMVVEKTVCQVQHVVLAGQLWVRLVVVPLER